MAKKTPQNWADELLAEFDRGRRDLKSGTKTAEQWVPELLSLLDNMRADLQSGAQPTAEEGPGGRLLSALPAQSSGMATDSAASGGIRSAFDEINRKER